nr:unnamed protein product [Digitaria exilis]
MSGEDITVQAEVPASPHQMARMRLARFLLEDAGAYRRDGGVWSVAGQLAVGVAASRARGWVGLFGLGPAASLLPRHLLGSYPFPPVCVGPLVKRPPRRHVRRRGGRERPHTDEGPLYPHRLHSDPQLLRITVVDKDASVETINLASIFTPANCNTWPVDDAPRLSLSAFCGNVMTPARIRAAAAAYEY